MPTRFRYTLHQLRIFHAVAEHGGVTRAAAALHLTQPTVSMQLRQLNEALGGTLLAPRGRALRLTPAGQEALEFAKTLLAPPSRWRSAGRSRWPTSQDTNSSCASRARERASWPRPFWPREA
jgi:DNA-binding transcriptional LysR family regulator